MPRPNMTIITQNCQNVKVYVTNGGKKRKSHATLLKEARAKARRKERKEGERDPLIERVGQKRRDALEIAQKMEKIGLERRAEAIKSCGTVLEVQHCNDCGTDTIKHANFCRDRLCPMCAWRLSLKRYKIMSAAIETIRKTQPEVLRHASLVTLTVRCCQPEDLPVTLSSMSEAWRYTISQRWARKALEGWGRSLEITYNHVKKWLHPHFHVLLLSSCEDTAKALINEWCRQASTRGLAVDLAAQDASIISADKEGENLLVKGIMECYKYSIKASDTLSMPLGALRAVALGLAGRRLIATGGILKQTLAAMQADLETLSESDTTDATPECPKCHSQRIDEIIWKWCAESNAYLAISGNSESVANTALMGRDGFLII